MLNLVSAKTGSDQNRKLQKSHWALLLIFASCLLLPALVNPTPAYATDYFPTSVGVVNGTITSGTAADVSTVNGVYLDVQETGLFQIIYDFTNLPGTCQTINFTGRYVGNAGHSVELQMWNYNTSSWVDVRALTKDLPHSTTDYSSSFTIPGTLSKYFSGTAPNLTARIRIYHTSGANSYHHFYTDKIALTSSTADLSLTKTVSGTPPIVGNTSIYTLSASNAGPNGATGVTVTDVLPAGVTYVSDDSGGTYNSGTGIWTVGSIAASGSATLHITVRVNTGTGGTVITNTAQVTGVNQPDPDSTPGDGAGDDYATVPFTVYAATLGMSAMTVGDFTGKTLSGAATSDYATPSSFSVTDARGTGAGWNITVQATQFREYLAGAYVGSGKTLATSSLSMPQPTVAANGTSSAVPTITAGPNVIGSGSAVKIASAAVNAGKGVYDFTQNAAGLTLSIPANAYATTYRSEVTVSVVSGP